VTLRVAHHIFDTPYFVILDVALFMESVILAFYGSKLPAPALMETIPFGILLGMNAALAYVMSIHRPLQPWCPQCHWDDGGDEEPAPEPVPPSGATVQG
jgi:hypothetical protein